MALELNGSTGVSLVQDGVVTAADLASTLDLTGKTVTLPAGVGGKVLQVVGGAAQSEASTTSTSFQDTGLSAAITPSNATSKIAIFVCLGDSASDNADTLGMRLRLVRDATQLGNVMAVNHAYTNANGLGINVAGFVYYDSPSTTSSVTYKAQFASHNGSNTVRVMRNNTQASIILMEIAG